MRVWSLTLSGRLCRVSSSFLENMAEEDNQSLYNENNRVRTLRDHMNPTRTSAPSCIVFPPDAAYFNFKSDIIQLLHTFHGLDLENPYLHLREFEFVTPIIRVLKPRPARRADPGLGLVRVEAKTRLGIGPEKPGQPGGSTRDSVHPVKPE